MEESFVCINSLDMSPGLSMGYYSELAYCTMN